MTGVIITKGYMGPGIELEKIKIKNINGNYFGSWKFRLEAILDQYMVIHRINFGRTIEDRQQFRNIEQTESESEFVESRKEIQVDFN